MAKALYGHLGAEAGLAAEVARLRLRVRELQDENDRLRKAAEQAEVAAIDWPTGDWLLRDDLLVPDPR